MKGFWWWFLSGSADTEDFILWGDDSTVLWGDDSEMIWGDEVWILFDGTWNDTFQWIDSEVWTD